MSAPRAIERAALEKCIATRGVTVTSEEVEAIARSLERIVEDKDATLEERSVTLVNSGVACWDIEFLLQVLPKLQTNIRQTSKESSGLGAR